MLEFAGINNFPVFLGAAILLNITPGSDTMYILAHTVAGGRWAGTLSVLGISTGGLVHTLAAACGLSALLAASPSLFLALKTVGALFLVYLGLRALRPAGQGGRRQGAGRICRSATKIYLSAVATNVLNPKVALFFLAFLPQFIGAEADSIPLAFMLLGLTFLTTGTLWCLLLVLFASLLSERLAAGEVLLSRLSGVVFIALGLSLAFSPTGS